MLAGIVALATNHRIYQDRSTPMAVPSFCGALLEAPAAPRVRRAGGGSPWRPRLAAPATRSRLPDACLAAQALQGATW
jgi:hypothetical protein